MHHIRLNVYTTSLIIVSNSNFSSPLYTYSYKSYVPLYMYIRIKYIQYVSLLYNISYPFIHIKHILFYPFMYRSRIHLYKLYIPLYTSI